VRLVITILETKLRAPLTPASAIARARLVGRVRSGLDTRLLLVSAPPGFGKTTLIAQALSAELPAGAAIAWVSLDRADDEPVVFWSYLVAAISAAAPDAGAAARELLDAPRATTAQLLVALINGLAGCRTELVLVLDDLHLIEGREIHEGLAFLLDRLPSTIHLVILTRSDPPLPLARMRVRGDLVEVRAADLRFTPQEAAAYLNERMALGLASADVDALESRTEGWIAALQMAALSMRDRSDAQSFIASFAGDDRYVVDYLADEVLERQTDAVRTFLLNTAVLDRLTGPLCDAVTGETGGTAMLEALDRANLFLVPLDDRRRWYRYHQLFADLLRARLLDQRPKDIPGLHRRASAWWETHDEPAEAIGHALAAGDHERAADLIEMTARALRRSRQELTLRRWLDALPEDLFAQRPVLAIAHVGALLSTGEADGVERRLAMAARWLPAASGGADRAAAEAKGMVVRHETALEHLPSAIPLYRAALARMRGDLPGTIEHARVAYAAAPEDQPLERGSAGGLLALAYWADGDLDAAHDAWTEAVADLERAGYRADMLGGTLAMGDIRIAQGRLAEAQRTLERGLRIGTEATPPLRGTADMHVGLAELHLERQDLAAARKHLDAAIALGEGLGLPQHPYRRRLALAGLRAAEGDLDAALTLVDEAERVYVADFFPEVRPIHAVRARLSTRLGRGAEALAWAAERSVTAEVDLAYLREYERITFAEALVAQARAAGGRGRIDEAGRLIAGSLIAAEAGGRQRSVIELLLLDALARDHAGDEDGSARSLDRAVALAVPEGLVRVFVERGSALTPLLEAARRRSAMPELAARVLSILRDEAPPAVEHPAIQQPLIEPLSARELDVLRLLATDLDGPEIAGQLFVSLNTLRTHTRNIYAKLEVNSRRAAVSRGRELGLLSQAR
jgi:LuxR family transcriptional regulator, maltose regulon positive regulatory protein